MTQNPIFLTGDVHQMSLTDPDHDFLSGTEMEAAIDYCDIADEHGISLTLFCTGKVLEEEHAKAVELAEMEHVEIAGHTWNAFMPKSLHYAFRLAFDSFYGPTPYQRRDIRKTLASVEAVTGKQCRSWRGHGFRGGERTVEILRETDVRVVSNDVGATATPRDLGELFSLPINTQPDHDHIRHGYKTEPHLERESKIREEGMRGFFHLSLPYRKRELRRLVLETGKSAFGIETNATDFQTELLTPAEWLERLKRDVTKQLSKQGYATVLSHPACMEIIDDMDLFADVCAFLEDKETTHVQDAPSLLS